MNRISEALSRIDEVPSGDSPSGVQLTELQRMAIRALLRTSTVAQAAELAGVPERTLQRWLSRPGFVSEYYAAGRAEIEESRRRLEHATGITLVALGKAREILRTVRGRLDCASSLGDRRRGDAGAVDGASPALIETDSSRPIAEFETKE